MVSVRLSACTVKINYHIYIYIYIYIYVCVCVRVCACFFRLFSDRGRFSLYMRKPQKKFLGLLDVFSF